MLLRVIVGVRRTPLGNDCQPSMLSINAEILNILHFIGARLEYGEQDRAIVEGSVATLP